MSEGAKKTGYGVGYGKPPVQHQFRPGSSGNPRGRPPKTAVQMGMGRELAELIRDVTSRAVPLQENGETVRVPVIEALLRRLCVSGMQGDVKASREVLRLRGQAEIVIESQLEAEAKTPPSGMMTGDQARKALLEIQNRRRREMERERQASDSPLPSAEGMTEKLPSASDAAADEDARADLGAMKSQVSAIGATPARDRETDVGPEGKVDYEDPSHEALIMERDAILAEAFAISSVLSPSNDPRYFELIFALNRLNKRLPAHLRKQLDIC